MPEKGIWPLAVPFAGAVIAAAFLVAVVLVVATFSGAPQGGERGSRRARTVPVRNGCSAAIQVGWVALDPRVPFDRDAAERFFSDALYVDDSQWPRIDEFSKYPNQSGIIQPGGKDTLVFDDAAAPRHRLLVVAAFEPKKERPSGTLAFRNIAVFDVGGDIPQEVSFEVRDGHCLPKQPLDRRYRF